MAMFSADTSHCGHDKMHASKKKTAQVIILWVVVYRNASPVVMESLMISLFHILSQAYIYNIYIYTRLQISVCTMNKQCKYDRIISCTLSPLYLHKLWWYCRTLPTDGYGNTEPTFLYPMFNGTVTTATTTLSSNKDEALMWYLRQPTPPQH